MFSLAIGAWGEWSATNLPQTELFAVTIESESSVTIANQYRDAKNSIAEALAVSNIGV